MSKRVVHFKTTTWDGSEFVPICHRYAPNEHRILTENAHDVTCKTCLQRKAVRLLLGPEWPDVEAISMSFSLVGAEWREKRQLKIRTRELTPDEVRVVTDHLLHMLHPTYLYPSLRDR